MGSVFQSSAHGGGYLQQLPLHHGVPCVSVQPLHLQLLPPEATVLDQAFGTQMSGYQLSGICVLIISNLKHALFYTLIHSLSLLGT